MFFSEPMNHLFFPCMIFSNNIPALFKINDKSYAYSTVLFDDALKPTFIFKYLSSLM